MAKSNKSDGAQKQQTLASSFELEGKGLHTGLSIKVKFSPASEGHGVKICRVDLPNRPTIPALAEFVTKTQRGTVLSNKDLQVSTVEHALSALYAMGVDNCLIEVNAPELPIFDGSASIYVEHIRRVGIKEQNAVREVYVVKSKIEVKDEQGVSQITILPDSSFGVHVLISFNSKVLSNQFATLQDVADFADEIAPARTFVFVREIESLLDNDLIKGGDLDNAIVIYDQEFSQDKMDKLAANMGTVSKPANELGYINNKPLKYNNEPARHKLLDLIGDLALIGRQLQGRVIATCPGHSINTKMAKLIRKDIRLNESQSPVYNPNEEPVLRIQDLKSLLPHRYPMLLVDKIIEIGPDHIVGVKNVTHNEPFFIGHFPDEPVMPGVLQVECMAQIGGVLILNQLENPSEYSTYFLTIDNVKFRYKVVPGDTLVAKVSLLGPVRRGIANMRGLAFVGEKLVCEAEFMAQIVRNAQ
ncbi:UDP-3-O-acyl-N-acetylglucosamine deacetylase [Porphyromonas levii]|uniref:bifunctional UDP-3-O-[3-hydroxymyristoyl] N-acetylglucosamine deacetylase/3-hydroxyacyl-ACP dehydratase n=1 Tax=Porphyromonas levii TaxID=28114 RepID=UPI001BAB43E7|nr:bifunctional UDP-3-O-[3-hydroxymyristoyl] N-acetylglucosamine deacetylase/3-hydroxyacyl-ACP dehydratase [Porphyromonas levii]MBR8764276.1 UDP-3-O-acyl-N-acetylglucosamine deacetylase [Porphyromonas levii]